MKNALDGLISRMDMDEKIISELQNISIEMAKKWPKGEEKKKKKKQNRIPKNCGISKKDVRYI